MSLIQEALRRKDDDDNDPSIPARIKLPIDLPGTAPKKPRPGVQPPRESSPAPAGRVVPSMGPVSAPTPRERPLAAMPPPLADRPRVKVAPLKPPPPTPKKKSPWPAVVGLLVLILLLVGGAVALLSYSAKFIAGTGTTAVVVTPPAPAPVPAAPPAGLAAEEKPAGDDEDVLLPTGKAAVASGAAEPRGTPATAKAEDAAAAKPEVPAQAAMSAPRAANGPVAGRVAVPPSSPGGSPWPRLKLDGVMARPNPRAGSAMINGTVVEAGERVQGVRLLEVTQSGALFELRGQTQFVRVGQTTL